MKRKYLLALLLVPTVVLGSAVISIGNGSGATKWNLTGNGGTDDTSNFVGTTDAQDLVFKANNAEAFRIDEAASTVDFLYDINSTSGGYFSSYVQTGAAFAMEDPGVGTDTVELQAPTLSSGYSLTFPTALPGSTLPMLSTSGGVMSFGQVNLTSMVTGVLPIANGGSNKALTLDAGGILYSDADSFEILGAGSSGQILRSGGAAAPTWSTATYPSSAGNAGRLLVSDGTNFSASNIDLADSDAVGATILGVANGGTGSASAGSSGNTLISNGSIFSAGTLNLASSNAVGTSILPVANGGTNLSALGTANQLLGVNNAAGAAEYKTLSGTSNQITVTHGANSITLSTPQDIATGSTPSFTGVNSSAGTTTIGTLAGSVDAGGATSFEIPNGAAPTTDAFGELAGDNDAWAASRGVIQFYDGTANTNLLGALTSDTPTTLQTPKWNTGGTITWEHSLQIARANNLKVGTANINCDAGSAITTNEDSMISTVGNISGGACAITFTGSYFSDTPICDVTFQNNSATMRSISYHTITSSGLTTRCREAAATGSASTVQDCTTIDYTLICIGDN
jgi:hypothetical protein